ncbi:unnamed protein product [Ectocarpus sp. 4 AP-2014]
MNPILALVTAITLELVVFIVCLPMTSSTFSKVMSPVLNLTFSFVPASIGPCRYSLNPIPLFNIPGTSRPSFILGSQVVFCSSSLSAKATDVLLNPSRPSVSSVSPSSVSNSLHTSFTTLIHSVGCLPILLFAHFASHPILGNFFSPIPYMRYFHFSFLASLPDCRDWIPSSALSSSLTMMALRFGGLLLGQPPTVSRRGIA